MKHPNKIKKSLVVIVWKPLAGSMERKILILLVTPERGSFWQSVTGTVEPGESFTEAALREAQEETQISFSRTPQYLGLEYEFEGRWGPVRERAFLLPVQGGDSPPSPILDSTEHVEFRWVNPTEAIKMVAHPGDKEAIERASREVPPLLLSKLGAFFQEGEEITHERTAELLHRSMAKDSEGYKVKIGEEELDVIVEDTPLFVRHYNRQAGEIILSNGEKNILNPSSIEIRDNNTWICKSTQGWPALFLSSAYYEITKDVRQGSVEGEYILNHLGHDHTLRISKKGKGVDR